MVDAEEHRTDPDTSDLGVADVTICRLVEGRPLQQGRLHRGLPVENVVPVRQLVVLH
ncbi:hypothetical protein D3C80_2189130 [compost metagenome]